MWFYTDQQEMRGVYQGLPLNEQAWSGLHLFLSCCLSERGYHEDARSGAKVVEVSNHLVTMR